MGGLFAGIEQVSPTMRHALGSPGVRVPALGFALVLTLTLAGCEDKGAQSLESFRAAWLEALSQDKPAALYALLDLRSRRHLALQLETLRGFDTVHQKAVLEHLGAGQLPDLQAMTTERYFELWWRKVLNGQAASAQVQPADGLTAWVEVSAGGVTQKFQATRESGVWVWRLPESNFESKAAAAASAPAPTKRVVEEAAPRTSLRQRGEE